MLRHQIRQAVNSRIRRSTAVRYMNWLERKSCRMGIDEVMGDEYSYVGAVVGATYPEMGKVLRKVMPKSILHSGSWLWCTGRKRKRPGTFLQ